MKTAVARREFLRIAGQSLGVAWTGLNWSQVAAALDEAHGATHATREPELKFLSREEAADRAGRATGVAYFDKERRERFQEGPRWGSEYKARLREFRRSMHIAGHATSLPLESNNVTLDPQVKDGWGMPAIRATYKDHPDDLATARFLQDRGAEILEAAGALRVTKAPVTEQRFSMHLLGTCRMGNDPGKSVIDKYHRTHDIRNLFICDGSSFVTSGRGQPTMTIQALAFRAGEHIAKFATRGEI